MEKRPEISKQGAFYTYPIKKVGALNLSDAYLLSISFINSIIFSVASRLPTLRSSRSLITFLPHLIKYAKKPPKIFGRLVDLFSYQMVILFCITYNTFLDRLNSFILWRARGTSIFTDCNCQRFFR